MTRVGSQRHSKKSDTFVRVLLFATLVKMFSVKPVISRYFRRFSVTTPSAEMAKGYASTLLTL
jgi:hypothetical protein